MRIPKTSVLILLFFITLFALAFAINIDGLTDNPQPSDVAIVPGSRVLPDGTPSRRLKARLDKAIELYRNGMYKHIIVSGGKGKEGFSEGIVMANYMLNQGAVPSQVIIIDERGDTTQKTALNSAAIMKAHGFTSAIVVTQYFHISRCKYALHQAGIKTVYAAHPHYIEWRDIFSITREVVALPFYYLRSL
ncbi:YdcF family protein [Herbaspirillum sp. RTI4]|uniref:YdcF family protein n=1 Tax=Herbaspirillum sp. RTI4 TaxID=3048640 RepID=UPI002AB48829|nr:YdcF family protein [Herbaspirillum sp. RTI4]MDY7576829.1 YdcF family protein [Herbaspirillum sp. RTI4]MEA9981425.1 YdcF family protein [Herbaspirillum sp. RTI4]